MLCLWNTFLHTVQPCDHYLSKPSPRLLIISPGKGETVVEIGSSTGYAGVAALKEGQSVGKH